METLQQLFGGRLKYLGYSVSRLLLCTFCGTAGSKVKLLGPSRYSKLTPRKTPSMSGDWICVLWNFKNMYVYMVVNQGVFLAGLKSAHGSALLPTRDVELCLFFSPEEQHLKMPHNSKRYQKVISSIPSWVSRANPWGKGKNCDLSAALFKHFTSELLQSAWGTQNNSSL